MNTLASECSSYEATHSSGEILDAFHDTFGEDAASELLDWYARAAEKHRALLRDLSDLAPTMRASEPEAGLTNLEARLERRMNRVQAELRAEMDGQRVRQIPGMLLVWWAILGSVCVLLTLAAMILQ